MCGIVGLVPKAINGFTSTQQKMFYQMLWANELRGADATGVIGVRKEGDFGIMKEAVASYYFVNSFIDSPLDKQMYGSGRAVVGHNRAKTVGENSDENAHPFVVDSTFAMVHNGTLRNHKELGDTKVDSEALAQTFKKAMDEEDWKDALEKAIGKIQGAYAVVWFDQKRNQMCLLRNSERPLGFVETDTCFLIASELPMASWIASRCSEKVVKFENCKVHTLYTFDLEKGKGALQETNLSPITPIGTKTKSTGYTNGTVVVHSGSDKTISVQGAGTTHTVTHTNGANAGLSKNAFKRLRASIIAKTIEFDLDDYVEGLGGTYRIMGTSTNGAYDLCDVRHGIHGVLNSYATQIEEEDFWGSPLKLKGRVIEAEYEKNTKSITITVGDIDRASNEVFH